MLIRYVGHSCFFIETVNATRIILDPFQPGAFNGRFRIVPYSGPVDAVVSSHFHQDHFHIDPSFGTPVVVTGPCQVRGVSFRCVDVPHGAPGGVDHGTVKVFCAQIDGMNVVHMGDAGSHPTQQQMDYIGHPDILFVPAGGRFTLGPAEAAALVAKWRPAIAVPMHCADPDVDIELRPVSEFVSLIQNVTYTGDTIEPAAPLAGRTVVVMTRR